MFSIRPAQASPFFHGVAITKEEPAITSVKRTNETQDNNLLSLIEAVLLTEPRRHSKGLGTVTYDLSDGALLTIQSVKDGIRVSFVSRQVENARGGAAPEPYVYLTYDTVVSPLGDRLQKVCTAVRKQLGFTQATDDSTSESVIDAFYQTVEAQLVLANQATA